MRIATIPELHMQLTYGAVYARGGFVRVGLLDKAVPDYVCNKLAWFVRLSAPCVAMRRHGLFLEAGDGEREKEGGLGGEATVWRLRHVQCGVLCQGPASVLRTTTVVVPEQVPGMDRKV